MGAWTPTGTSAIPTGSVSATSSSRRAGWWSTRLLELDRFRIASILVNRAAHDALLPALSSVDTEVYVCDDATLAGITGFNFHRGCLALASRPMPQATATLLGGSRILALEGVGNPDNVGGLFRTAAAFGVDGILLNATSGDPLYRKAIRTSMGAALRLPHARSADWLPELDQCRAAGFTVVALTPHPSAVTLAEFARAFDPKARLLLLVGAEGPGLGEATLDARRRARAHSDRAGGRLAERGCRGGDCAGAPQELAARRASERTASTIDIRPMPLPIEMFCRKMRSTMDGSTCAIASAGSPDSERWRIAASALADTPDGFSTAKCSVSVPSGRLHRPDVGVGLALRDLMRLVERPRRDLGRHLAELIGVAEKQAGAIRRIRETGRTSRGPLVTALAGWPRESPRSPSPRPADHRSPITDHVSISQ